MMSHWVDLFRSLGQALLDVFKAELAEVGEDLGTAGRHLGVALGLFAAAAAVGFWTLAAFLYFVIQLLARLGLPLWGAAGVVTLVLVLVIALLGWLGYRRLQRVENPVETVRRRLDDHTAWWQERMLTPAEELPEADREPWESEDR
jgi:hypothetical protein